ncbi:hypothetical protein [Frondihabitans australicus]|uniref:hypothetical protein n=1 Tax=Frondihabitans australicus TaxID=386892 RepID=UPI000EAE6498|nr:hypothetical protein [Frondihabitans australicus]
MYERISRRQRAATPFDGQRGFWARINRALYPLAGPASLGAGHPEEPYRAPADPLCPICGTPLATHDIDRSLPGARARLTCPT